MALTGSRAAEALAVGDPRPAGQTPQSANADSSPTKGSLSYWRLSRIRMDSRNSYDSHKGEDHPCSTKLQKGTSADARPHPSSFADLLPQSSLRSASSLGEGAFTRKAASAALNETAHESTFPASGEGKVTYQSANRFHRRDPVPQSQPGTPLRLWQTPSGTSPAQPSG